MPSATNYSDFSRSRPRDHFSADSGDLGRPDATFLPDATEDSPFAQSVTLDAARERLNEEIRRLNHAIQELSSNLEESNGALTEQQQRRAKATGDLRVIEQEPGKHGRGVIARAYQEWAQAETAANGLRELCDQLRTAIESDRRCLEALELALGAMADATFLSEHQTPLGDVANFMAVSRSLAGEAPMMDYPPPKSHPLTPSQPPRSVTVAQLVDQESLLVAREYDRRALAHNVDARVRQALEDAILRAELCEAALRNDPSTAFEATHELKDHLMETLHETRMLIAELEPMMLSELGLAGTLQRYVQDLITEQGVHIGMSLGINKHRYHMAIERAVFRVAREALANAMRHAHAQRIQVALNHLNGALILSVEDDGVGFEVDSVMERARRGLRSGLGQLCLEADLVGGILGVKSSKGKGTRIDYIVAETLVS